MNQEEKNEYNKQAVLNLEEATKEARFGFATRAIEYAEAAIKQLKVYRGDTDA